MRGGLEGGVSGGRRREHEGEALKGLPFKPLSSPLEGSPLKGASKGRRGLKEDGGEEGGEALKGYPSSPI